MLYTCTSVNDVLIRVVNAHVLFSVFLSPIRTQLYYQLQKLFSGEDGEGLGRQSGSVVCIDYVLDSSSTCDIY